MGAKQRITSWLKERNISVREFTKTIETSHTLFASGENLGSDKLEKIAKHYPDMDLVWVITGNSKEGVLKNNTINISNNVEKEISAIILNILKSNKEFASIIQRLNKMEGVLDLFIIKDDISNELQEMSKKKSNLGG